MFDQLLATAAIHSRMQPTFEELANKLLGDAELEYQKDIYLLRLLYNRVIAVLDAVVSSSVIIEDNDLDFAYVQLTALIDDLLTKPSMKSWQKDAPELYERCSDTPKK